MNYEDLKNKLKDVQGWKPLSEKEFEKYLKALETEFSVIFAELRVEAQLLLILLYLEHPKTITPLDVNRYFLFTAAHNQNWKLCLRHLEKCELKNKKLILETLKGLVK